MDDNEFDRRLETIANRPGRRAFVVQLSRLILVGVGGATISPWPGAAQVAYADGQPGPTCPAPECVTASRCGDRHYCDEAQECICTRSVEGGLQCGRLPSTCDVPLCEKSDDCAFLGPGYFCDTPHSGCCHDGEKTRCLAPCIEPLLGDVNCSSCGTCQQVEVGDVPPDGSSVAVCVSDCTTSCDSVSLCAEANQDLSFRRLGASLILQGFTTTAGAKTYILMHSGTEIRRMTTVEYQQTGTQRTGMLVHGREKNGASASYALVISEGNVEFGLQVGSSGYIEKIHPDADAFQPPNDPFTPTALAGGGPGIAFAIDATSCGIMCNSVCALLLSGVGCAIAASLICSFTGPGFLLCAVVIGATCSVVAGAGCYAACDQGLCKPGPKPKTIWCECTQSCYSSAENCLAECRPSLGCFTGICEPNPTKCPSGGST